MTFYTLLLKTCGDNKVTWWNCDNHAETGVIGPELDLRKLHGLPKPLLNAEVARVGAEGNKLLDVGLETIKWDS